MRQVLNILEDVIKAYGVQLQRYGKDFSGLELFDEGLRSRLYETYDAGPLKASLRVIESNAFYIIKDDFRCNYCFFIPPPPNRFRATMFAIALSAPGWKYFPMTRSSTVSSDRIIFPIISAWSWQTTLTGFPCFPRPAAGTQCS
jgi:hypothetical protein